MKQFDVVLLTDDRYIDPSDPDEFVSNVLKEDQLVLNSLQSRGLITTKKSWSDPVFEWSTTRYALFRTTWDYAERFTEFSDWLMRVAAQTRLINSYDLLVWNLDKHYLQDLKFKGVHVVETYFIEFGDQRTLAEIHSALGWTKTVIKPVVSAAAKDTYVLEKETFSQHEKLFRELIRNESMMLQPFQKSITERGELSLMVIGGEYTHAVLKKAKAGDFRVQDDFGGSVHEYEPTSDEIDLAIAAVKACDPIPIYARVDIISDNDGKPAVSELELLEPEMWFRRKENASEKLADQIATAYF